MRFLFSLLILTAVYGGTFQTAMGDCEILLDAGDKDLEKKITQITIDVSEKMVKEFGDVKPKDFSIVVVPSKDEFIRKTKGHAPEWSMAVAMNRTSTIILQSPAITHISYNRFLDVVVHELNHLYLYRISQNGSFPSWFSEGLAMRQAGEFSVLHKIRISQAKWRNDLLPISRIHSMRIHPTNKISLAYGQAAAAVYAMEYYYGSSVFALIFEEMNGLGLNSTKVKADFQTAFQRVTHNDQLDFQDKYFSYIRENYNWLFLLKITNLVFISLPIILVGGYYYKRNRNKKKLAFWQAEEELEDLQNIIDEADGETQYN
jgi:hypothetical protein